MAKQPPKPKTEDEQLYEHYVSLKKHLVELLGISPQDEQKELAIENLMDDLIGIVNIEVLASLRDGLNDKIAKG